MRWTAKGSTGDFLVSTEDIINVLRKHDLCSEMSLL